MINQTNLDLDVSNESTVMKFILLGRGEQVKHIVNLSNTIRDTELINSLIKMYESKYGEGSFEFDRLRDVYSFLGSMDVYQTVNLYDGMTSFAKDLLIEIIKVDHDHLYKVVDIHNHVMLINEPATSSTYQ